MLLYLYFDELEEFIELNTKKEQTKNKQKKLKNLKTAKKSRMEAKRKFLWLKLDLTSVEIELKKNNN